MRVVVCAGPGGAGTSTIAAATAVQLAESGSRPLLLTAQPPEAAAGDGLGIDFLVPDAADIDDQLWAVARPHLDTLAGRLRAEALDRDELVELPGAGALATLQALAGYLDDERWDVVVLDAAGELGGLAMLAAPARLSWYLRRLLPVPAALLPALLGQVSLPGSVPPGLLPALAAVSQVHSVLSDATRCTVRLVSSPDSRGTEAVRRESAWLRLNGLSVGHVVLNRLVPAGSDPWRAVIAARQAEHSEQARTWSGRPVSCVELLPAEPSTGADLRRIAESVGNVRWEPADDQLLHVRPRADSRTFDVLIAARGLQRDETTISRTPEDLVLTTWGRRTFVSLPSVLRRCTVASASVTDEGIELVFEADPGLWPR